MFVPSIYRTDDPARIRRVIARHPLALLLSNGEPSPFATHLPVIFDDPDAAGDLTDSILLGHLNRANPHWRALNDGAATTLVFAGPGGYVSPMLYRTDPAAPTWNFVSVHVHGSLHPIRDAEETFQVVRRTADRLERAFGAGWDPRPSEGYFRSIQPGVGAFRVRIRCVDAMFKLSQEKTPEIQERVIHRCEQIDRQSELGRVMRDFGLGLGDRGVSGRDRAAC
jgi:transcriptional regulator